MSLQFGKFGITHNKTWQLPDAILFGNMIHHQIRDLKLLDDSLNNFVWIL